MRPVGGLDPSASARRPSGVAIIDVDGRTLSAAGLRMDDEDLISALRGVELIAIDSPLSVPDGAAFREVDIEMMHRGYRVLPPSWRWMRALVERSLGILKSLDVPAFETHPRSALISSGCRDAGELLDAAGIEHGALPTSKDALDAVVAAVVAFEIAEGTAIDVRAADGDIYLSAGLCRARGAPARPPRPTSSSRPAHRGTADPSPPPS